MKIIFLGTNGWYDTKTGDTNCVLIDSPKYYLILDAGNGFYKIDKYIKKDKPIYLFIGHLHIDHISGLHILSKFRFKTALKIFSYSGAKKDLITFLNHPFTMPYQELPYKVEINELTEGKHQLPLQVETKKLYHADFCFGYRIKVENKTITYCADTGVGDNIIYLANEVDLLIHECTYKKADLSAWGHTNPTQTAELAKKAKAKKLVLTHFAANIYLSLKDRQTAEKQAQKIFPNTSSAKDGMIINI